MSKEIRFTKLVKSGRLELPFVVAAALVLSTLVVGSEFALARTHSAASNAAAVSKPVDVERLVFDGFHLRWKRNSAVVATYEAFSGQPGMTHDEAQKELGATPQGVYTVNPSSIQDLSDQSAEVRRDWGVTRVPLEQQAAVRRRILDCLKVDRVGFYVHGGTEKGTKGCIEINDSTQHTAFFKRLKDYGKPIDLEISFTGDAESKLEVKACPYPPAVAEAVGTLELGGLTAAMVSANPDGLPESTISVAPTDVSVTKFRGGQGAFGYSRGPGKSHSGIDIVTNQSNPDRALYRVMAVHSGTVAYARYNGNANEGYGYTVVVDHGDGFYSLYAHLATNASKDVCKVGDTVAKGATIGYFFDPVTGERSTGNAACVDIETDKNMVHFELFTAPKGRTSTEQVGALRQGGAIQNATVRLTQLGYVQN